MVNQLISAFYKATRDAQGISILQKSLSLDLNDGFPKLAVLASLDGASKIDGCQRGESLLINNANLSLSFGKLTLLVQYPIVVMVVFEVLKRALVEGPIVSSMHEATEASPTSLKSKCPRPIILGL